MKPSRPSGWTLVEILVAVAIAAILATVIFSIYRAMWRTTRTVEEGRVGLRAVSALETLTRDLECCAGAGFPGHELPFALDPGPMVEDRCSVLAVHTVFLPEGERDPLKCAVGIARYYVAPKEDRRVLMRELRVVDEKGAVCDGNEKEIAADVRSFQVAVFDGTEWHDGWPPQGGRPSPLPAAVRVLVSCKTGEKQSDAATTIRIPVGTEFTGRISRPKAPAPH